MALRETTRRWTMRTCQLVLVACVAALVALRLGRPLYYTDGESELTGSELATSGMLQWLPPVPQNEVPGPVRGRIAALPDGRLLYGRATEDGSTDLVVWNPAEPALSPERVHGLCSDGHDLAPAVGTDGRIWFASDREGEGYELFVAPRLLALSNEVARVAATASDLDETDPAPSPDGRELVFVRVDRTIAGGDDGELWRIALDGSNEPERVFARRDPLQPRVVDRDPVFAPDGAALWFVRKVAGRALETVRSSRLQTRYDEPLALRVDDAGPALRSPLPLVGGRRLLGLQAELHDTPLLYESNAREVYPWWPGQSTLEWILVAAAAFCVLLLSLLHFGRRWATLDLVAQCLILSLLLHLLVFALLKGLAIESAAQEGERDDGGIAISFASLASAATSGGPGGDVASEVRFQARERALAAEAPGAAELPESGAALAVTDGEWQREAEASEHEPQVALQDAPSALSVRSGADAIAPAVASLLPAVARAREVEASEAERERAKADGERSLRVDVPGSAVARSKAAVGDLVREAVREDAVADAREVASPAPRLRDAAAALAAPRTTTAGSSENAPAKATPSAVAAVEVPRASALPRASRAAETPPPSSREPAPVPSSSLPRTSSATPTPAAAPAPRTSLPTARALPRPTAIPRDAHPANANALVAAGTTSRSAAPSGPAAVPLAIAVPDARASEPMRPRPREARASRADFAVGVPSTSLAKVASRAPEVAAAARAVPETKTAYSNRFGPQKAKALEQFGGTDATEKAVRDGLAYLARIQRADGSWGDPERFDTKYGMVHVGKSALCLLAFLGAGHTPKSNTEHSGVVQKAVDFLLRVQDADTGAFGPSSCYGHGISTYALAECYGMTKDEDLLQPLERALVWILDHQGPKRDKRNRGGWGYFSPGLRAEDDYARVSVTSWMVMALESARLSGIEPPEDVLPAAKQYLELSFDKPNGWFRYNHEPSRLRSAWPTLPASTPAGGFCLQLLGAAKDDAMVQAAVEFTVARRPEQYRRYDDDDFVLRGQGNVYFWYYGSLCCFLAGGDAWKEWNERLSTVLPKAQQADGSFPPIDVYAQEAGDNKKDRSYTTAMCVLSLEVYYRYFTPLLTGR